MISEAFPTMTESYPEFFRRITGNGILPYQERHGLDPFSSKLLIVPTGLGKTDAVLCPWLYALATNKPSPTRFFVVEPRQNLTAQVARVVRKRLESAGLTGRAVILELMAGSSDNDEKLQPDQAAVIVATQDLYFSRALNRGYARRPPRWPIDFALYNQDCLIVLDEIQLMDDALATSTQLAAFRNEFGITKPASCLWMSATVNREWLQTADHQQVPPILELNPLDKAESLVQKRLHSAKSLKRAPETCRTPEGCAAFVLERHSAGTRSLVIANTVPRAREIFGALRQEFSGVILLHSRFRPLDRVGAVNQMLGGIPSEGQIIVATQILEAGVDITSRLLVTDVAPWGSLVQRFGRVNRYGDDLDAEAYWVDEPQSSKQKNPALPYREDEIARAKDRLAGLRSASPADLPAEDGPEPWQHVLRRSDLLDLFDTTPDLSGNELDVSRFIRATEERDAYLAWRVWEQGQGVPQDMGELVDSELCPVPLGELREFMKKRPVYVWDYAMERWVEGDRDRLYAGMLVLANSASGGYTTTEGWSPDSKLPVPAVDAGQAPIERNSSDTRSFQKYRQTLRAHSTRVVEELDKLLKSESLKPEMTEALRVAAAKHDWGKAHPVFQETLHRNDPSPELLAKQDGPPAKHGRPHFRHELASALAMLQTGDSDLAACLAAAHHGRVRLGIRSMPGEREESGCRTARGIQEGDVLPACELGRGARVPEVVLSLAPMEFGADGGSWTSRVLRLRDELGPFRLAYLEMLLRSADEKASQAPGPEVSA